MKIIRFSAIWCSGCLVMRPRWNEIFKNYDFEITDYDYDMNPDEVVKYQIGKIVPVVIFMKNDIEVYRMIGEKSKKELEETITRIVSEVV